MLFLDNIINEIFLHISCVYSEVNDHKIFLNFRQTNESTYNDSGDIISQILIKISVGRVFNVDGI